PTLLERILSRLLHPLLRWRTPRHHGGHSFASTGDEASVFARYHFRPHLHQHAGFRLVAPSQREEATSFLTSCV
ncbi:unnamed protein product, partial [Scytosiphon promiscuus]